MQIAYTLTPKDYWQLHRRTMNRSPQIRLLRVIGIVAILGIAIFISMQSPLTHGDWKLILSGAGGIVLLFGILTAGSSYLAATQAYVNRPNALATRILRLSQEGVRAETPGMATRLSWSEVSKLAEDHGYLEFCTKAPALTTHTITFFVPVRAFPSLADAQSFLVQANGYRSAASAAPVPDVPVTDDLERRMSASYALTLGELVWTGTQSKQRVFMRTYVLPPLGAIVFFSILWIQFGSVLPAAVGAGVFMVLFAVMMQFVFRRGPNTTGNFARPMIDYRIILLSSGFELRSSAGLNCYEWALLTRIDVKKRYLLFQSAKSMVCIVPPSAFGSADEAQAFLNTARAFHQSAITGEAAPQVEQAASWPPPPRR